MPKLIIASGPVIVEQGKVLLCKHGEDNFYKFCGGRVENFEENLIEAAKREAKEEMDIDIKVVDAQPFLTHVAKSTDQGETDIILAHYLAERIGEIKPGPEIRQWDWVPIDRLDDFELAPNIKPTLTHFGFLK
jgi:ADP-ribose pyrophosphatase YjhB (NUDIX family)